MPSSLPGPRLQGAQAGEGDRDKAGDASPFLLVPLADGAGDSPCRPASDAALPTEEEEDLPIQLLLSPPARVQGCQPRRGTSPGGSPG